MTFQEKVKAEAEKIDRHFQAMLVDGLTTEDIIQIRSQRDQAHEALSNWVLQQTIGSFFKW